MKKPLLVLLGSALLLASPTRVYAQKEANEHVFTAGAAYSLAGLFANLFKDAVNTATDVKVSVIPALIANYDYGIASKFSLGAAFSYQQMTLEYKDTDTSNNQTFNYKDKLSRTNVGLRPLFHFGENENLDTYFGFRLSMTFWDHSSNNPRVTGSSTDIWNSGKLRFQALFGARYFFNDFLGFNGEVAIGPPYYAAMGLNLRIK